MWLVMGGTFLGFQNAPVSEMRPMAQPSPQCLRSIASFRERLITPCAPGMPRYDPPARPGPIRAPGMRLLADTFGLPAIVAPGACRHGSMTEPEGEVAPGGQGALRHRQRPRSCQGRRAHPKAAFGGHPPAATRNGCERSRYRASE
jgi:hypothetical protein